MELVEREQCLAELAKCLATAVRDGGCIAFLEGEAGVGKTALLQEFCRRQHEVPVLWGACDALFTPRPLAPLHDIARQTQGALLAAVNSGATPAVIFAAALHELERTPALVVFEDVHWADEATLDLLKYLGRRIHRTHALLAVSYRNDELGPRHPLRFVIGDSPRASTCRMPLAPLSEAAVTQLASQAGRPVKGLYSITGGNPFFVTEVLATAAETVPVTVRDAVLARAVRLRRQHAKSRNSSALFPERWSRGCSSRPRDRMSRRLKVAWVSASCATRTSLSASGMSLPAKPLRTHSHNRADRVCIESARDSGSAFRYSRCAASPPRRRRTQ